MDRQRDVPVIWDGMIVEKGFRADLILEHKVIVEIKSVEEVSRLNQKQVQTYLTLTGLKLALLVDLNEVLIKDGIQRIVHSL